MLAAQWCQNDFCTTLFLINEFDNAKKCDIGNAEAPVLVKG